MGYRNIECEYAYTSSDVFAYAEQTVVPRGYCLPTEFQNARVLHRKSLDYNC